MIGSTLSHQDEAEIITEAFLAQYPAPEDNDEDDGVFPGDPAYFDNDGDGQGDEEDMYGVIEATHTDAIVQWSDDETYRVPLTMVGDVVTFAPPTEWVEVCESWVDDPPDPNEPEDGPMAAKAKKPKRKIPYEAQSWQTKPSTAPARVEPMQSGSGNPYVGGANGGYKSYTLADSVSMGVKKILASKRYEGAMIWMGSSHNSFKDRSPDPKLAFLPRKAIAADIAMTSKAIAEGWAMDPDLVYLCGKKFVDYGPLLEEHDHNRPFGNTVARFMLDGSNSCFEIGWCRSDIGKKWMGQGPVEMSLGFVYTGEDEEGHPKSFHCFERSVLKKGDAMNPITWWAATEYKGFDLGAAMKIVDSIREAQ